MALPSGAANRLVHRAIHGGWNSNRPRGTRIRHRCAPTAVIGERLGQTRKRRSFGWSANRLSTEYGRWQERTNSSPRPLPRLCNGFVMAAPELRATALLRKMNFLATQSSAPDAAIDVEQWIEQLRAASLELLPPLLLAAHFVKPKASSVSLRTRRRRSLVSAACSHAAPISDIRDGKGSNAARSLACRAFHPR